MKSGTRKNFFQLMLYGLAVFGVLTAFYNVLSGVSTPVQAQQDPFLTQRLNQIEQRFNSFETRITRLEQELRYTGIMRGTPANNDNTEIRLLNSQMEIMQRRIGEIECALLKLDERTLTDAARQGRRKTGGDLSEACRRNSNVPLQLSVFP